MVERDRAGRGEVLLDPAVAGLHTLLENELLQPVRLRLVRLDAADVEKRYTGPAARCALHAHDGGKDDRADGRLDRALTRTVEHVVGRTAFARDGQRLLADHKQLQHGIEEHQDFPQQFGECLLLKEVLHPDDEFVDAESCVLDRHAEF